MPLHQEQLNFMISLAHHRIELFNPFFRMINYIDSPYFNAFLVAIIWLGFSYKWGLRIFFWCVVNVALMHTLKDFFQWSRPSTDMPQIALVQPEVLYGFPSGSAQIAMFLGGLLIYYSKTWTFRIIGILYILLISFSRLYLGVHYPLDILGGLIVGSLLLTLFIYIEEPLEKLLKKKGISFCLFLAIAIPLVGLMLFPNLSFALGAMMGIGVGSCIAIKHKLFLPNPTHLMEGIGRAFISVCFAFFLIVILPHKESFFAAVFISLIMSLAVSPFCGWLIHKKVS